MMTRRMGRGVNRTTTKRMGQKRVGDKTTGRRMGQKHPEKA